MTTSVTQLWNLIESRGFCEDIKDIRNNDDDDAIMMRTMTTITRRITSYQTKLNDTKMDITRSFLKLQAPDFAW